MESHGKMEDIIVRKGLFRKKVNLNQVTHIVMENLRAHYWVGNQMIYQCQFSQKEMELTEKVFAQPTCQYIEIKPYEKSEVVAFQNQEACLQGEVARVQKVVDKYNAKTGFSDAARYQSVFDIRIRRNVSGLKMRTGFGAWRNIWGA